MVKCFSKKVYVPILGAVAGAIVLAKAGRKVGIGSTEGILYGAATGFIGSCVLLLFDWLETAANVAKQKKHQQEKDECKLFEGFPKQPPSRTAALPAVIIFIFACTTFWIPLFGLIITSFAIYRAGRDELPRWVGRLGVCLLLVSVAITLVTVFSPAILFF